MKKLTVKILILGTLLLCPNPAFSYSEPTLPHYTIDSHKNAVDHNNMGLMYLEEHGYYAAIQEFKIAISLAPDTQASSVFYKNLGDTYMLVGEYLNAKDCYQKAINLYSMNFQFYKDLTRCYKALGVTYTVISEYNGTKNLYNPIMRGLLQEQNGDIKSAITTLDNFIAAEPNLLITPSVKQYVKTLVKKVNK